MSDQRRQAPNTCYFLGFLQGRVLIQKSKISIATEETKTKLVVLLGQQYKHWEVVKGTRPGTVKD